MEDVATWSHMYVRFCTDKEFANVEVSKCLDLSLPRGEEDYDARKCYTLRWADGNLYKVQICFIGKSEEDVEQRLEQRRNSNRRFRFMKCEHSESDIEEEIENNNNNLRKRQRLATKVQKVAITKAKKVTDKENLQDRLKIMSKKSMIDDSPGSTDDNAESSDEPSLEDSARIEKNSNGTREVLNRAGNSSKCPKESERTVRRQLFSKEDSLNSIPGPSSDSQRTEENIRQIYNPKTASVRKYSKASICKNFKIDSSLLVNPMISDSSRFEHAAVLPRYEIFYNINKDGIQIKCVHLGNGFYITQSAWELIELEKGYSKFVKYLAQALWGEEYLANSYVEESQFMISIPGQPERKRLDSPRKSIIRQCLDDLLEDRKVDALTKLKEVRNIGHYLGEHIVSLRHRFYPDTIRKKKRSNTSRTNEQQEL